MKTVFNANSPYEKSAWIFLILLSLALGTNEVYAGEVVSGRFGQTACQVLFGGPAPSGAKGANVVNLPARPKEPHARLRADDVPDTFQGVRRLLRELADRDQARSIFFKHVDPEENVRFSPTKEKVAVEHAAFGNFLAPPAFWHEAKAKGFAVDHLDDYPSTDLMPSPSSVSLSTITDELNRRGEDVHMVVSGPAKWATQSFIPFSIHWGLRDEKLKRTFIDSLPLRDSLKLLEVLRSPVGGMKSEFSANGKVASFEDKINVVEYSTNPGDIHSQVEKTRPAQLLIDYCGLASRRKLGEVLSTYYDSLEEGGHLVIFLPTDLRIAEYKNGKRQEEKENIVKFFSDKRKGTEMNPYGFFRRIPGFRINNIFVKENVPFLDSHLLSVRDGVEERYDGLVIYLQKDSSRLRSKSDFSRIEEVNEDATRYFSMKHNLSVVH